MAFNLKATVPPHMLSICQDAIPRPNWEPTLSAVISSIMILLFGAVTLNAYLEVYASFSMALIPFLMLTLY